MLVAGWGLVFLISIFWEQGVALIPYRVASTRRMGGIITSCLNAE